MFEILLEIRLVVGLVVLGLIGVMAARSLTMGVLCIESDWGVVAAPVGGVEGRWSEGTNDRSFQKRSLQRSIRRS